MPLYEVKCSICGEHQDIFRSLANYDDLPDCCGQRTERVLSAPAVLADIQPYQSMATGEWITSRSQHRDHLKSQGLTEVGNDSMVKKESYLDKKQQKEALRREIAQRLDTVS